jgi:hypothetical protein
MDGASQAVLVRYLVVGDSLAGSRAPRGYRHGLRLELGYESVAAFLRAEHRDLAMMQ